MFEKAYPFQLVHQTTRKKGELEITISKFSFRANSGLRYIIQTEEFPYFVFSVAFYQKNHTDSDDRYHFITGQEAGHAHRIITTCTRVMEHILEQNPYASFTFIGAHSLGEGLHNTKRFRIYSGVMARLYSPLLFWHYQYIEQSAFLLLNRNNQEPDLFPKVESMLKTYYLDEKEE